MTTWAVLPLVFKINSKGSSKFGELTGSHLPDKSSDLKYRLGIMLDGSVEVGAGNRRTNYQ